MRIIDVNCDMGESFGCYRMGCDREIIKVISSANIACGFHAGDPLVMKETVQLALAAGVGIGAHPGFHDLVGFGRRPMPVDPRRLKEEILYQLGALSAIARGAGGQLQHVKPHGALNNLAAEDKRLALVIAEATALFDESLYLIAPAGSSLEMAGEEMGLTVAREAYADRAYQARGNLVPRGVPGAVIQDLDMVLERVLRLVQERELETIEGDIIPIHADTICIHGDTPSALTLASRIRGALREKGIQVLPLAHRFSLGESPLYPEKEKRERERKG